MTQPELEPQQPRCIDLDAQQSERLNQACNGEFGQCFIVTARATHPGEPERWRLWIVPSTASRVNLALRKLMEPPKAAGSSAG